MKTGCCGFEIRGRRLKTFTYNYAITRGAAQDIVHFWSLNVEEHFYLLLPAFLILVPRTKFRIGALVFGVLVVVTLFRWLVPVDADPYVVWRFLNFSSHTRFDGLLLGVLIAIIQKQGRFRGETPKSGERGAGIFAATVAFVVVACVRHPFHDAEVVQIGHLIATVASAVLVVIAAYDQDHIFPFPGTGRALEIVGARAYPLYLLHHPIGRAFDFLLRDKFSALGNAGTVLFFGALLTLIFGVAELCHRFIELPLLEVGRRLRNAEGRLVPSLRLEPKR